MLREQEITVTPEHMERWLRLHLQQLVTYSSTPLDLFSSLLSSFSIYRSEACHAIQSSRSHLLESARVVTSPFIKFECQRKWKFVCINTYCILRKLDWQNTKKKRTVGTCICAIQHMLSSESYRKIWIFSIAINCSHGFFKYVKFIQKMIQIHWDLLDMNSDVEKFYLLILKLL